MLNKAERYKQINRIRRRALPASIRIMADGLTKAIQPILDNLERYATPEDAQAEAVELLDVNKIEDAYIRLYEVTMQPFAAMEFRRLLRQKAEIEDLATLNALWFESVRNYIQYDIAERVTGVGNTTKKRIQSMIQDGINQGMSIPDISKNINQLGLPDIIRKRSTVIARTEVINASNFGIMQGGIATGLALNKIWISTIDGRERVDHADADGQIVDMADKFLLGGQECDYPGDPSLPADQVIQCRCTHAFIPKEAGEA